ncbi:uncharacterized protein [Periplaneta americana]|uniref:uncharacterized protein n=1 Tax=Periplaneta americana TaxID=6978 RepID=UPI0037E99997
MDWPNDLCLDLIDLYKEHPVLWDQKHPSHYSKKRKIEAWDIIAMKLGVDMQSAQKKMMSLLGSFRAQKSKGRRSIETEQGRKDVYVSKWFGFDRMRFLLDKDDFRSTMDIECNRLDLNGCEALSLDESVTTIEKLDDSEGNDETSATADEAEHSDTPKDRIAAENAAYSSSYYKAKKIKKENSYQDPRIGDVFTLRDVHDHYIVSQTQVTSPPDRFTVYGLHVANKLRTYNTRTANIVEHAVNNILFQADMGNYDTDHADNHDSQSYLS